mgnify:CR=1 FL=1
MRLGNCRIRRRSTSFKMSAAHAREFAWIAPPQPSASPQRNFSIADSVLAQYTAVPSGSRYGAVINWLGSAVSAQVNFALPPTAVISKSPVRHVERFNAVWRN